MKKNPIAFMILAGMMLLLLPVTVTQAKEIPADGNIPLTSEYFPDGWFLKNRAKPYDKDKNGYLSPEEIAEVTKLNLPVDDPSLFLSIQYFTNLKELEMDSYGDMDDSKGVWVGPDIDLTVFPNLEEARISLDTGRAPGGSPKVQIKASGLTHLKRIEVVDRNKEVKEKYDGQKVRIGVVDLQDTPALEFARIYDAKGVIFGDRNRLRDVWLGNLQEMPTAQIEGFTEMEHLYTHEDVPDFTSLDLSKCHALKKLQLFGEYMETIKFSDADQLDFVKIESNMLQRADLSDSRSVKELHFNCPKLTGMDISGNPNLEYLGLTSSRVESMDISENKKLKTLYLKCPALDILTLAGADALERAWIDASALEDLDISKNQNLKQVSLTSSRLDAFDVGKNPGLESLAVDSGRLKTIDVAKNKGLKKLYVSSDVMKTLNLKKNRALEVLGVHCKKMRVLDLSANTGLVGLDIDATPLKKLDLKKQKKLKKFRMGNNQKPPKLDLSANVNLKEVVIENTSYKEISLPDQKKLQWLHMMGNKKLEKVDLKNNRSLSWLIINGSKKLKKLDLTNNAKLTQVDVRDNALKTLKLREQQYPWVLFCQGNKLKVLDLTDVGSALEELWCDKGMKVKGYTGKIIYL